MADGFGDGLELETPVIAPVVETALETAVVPSTPMLDAFRAKVGDVEGIENDEQLLEALGPIIDRDSLVRSTVGETFDEARLRSLLDAEQRYQQVAPNLDQYEAWRQSQLNPSPVAPVVTPAAETKRRWERMEFDTADLQYVEIDQATGLYRAKRPELSALADKANAFARRQREINLEQTRDPYAYGQEIVAPHLAPRDAKIAALEAKLAALESQSAVQNEWTDFIAQHGKDLQSFDVTKGVYVPTKAGEVFNSEVNQLITDGIDPAKAREIALRHARAVTGSAVVGTTPAPKGERVITRLKAKPGDIVPEAAGTLNTPGLQNTRPMSGRALMQHLIAQEMHAAGLPYEG